VPERHPPTQRGTVDLEYLSGFGCGDEGDGHVRETTQCTVPWQALMRMGVACLDPLHETVHTEGMSEMTNMDTVAEVSLEWDVADRLRKSLRASGIGVQDMADYLGMSRNSVSNWVNGRAVPDHRTLLVWSMKTGAPLAWLEHGDEAPSVRRQGLEPRTRCLGDRPRHLYAV
jgi:DNA-binding transcriptional regulator YiaG